MRWRGAFPVTPRPSPGLYDAEGATTTGSQPWPASPEGFMPSGRAWASIGLAAAVIVGLAAPQAQAYQWPLLPHCQSLAFFPDPMTADQDISVLLSYSS